jgi:hypothetical protein
MVSPSTIGIVGKIVNTNEDTAFALGFPNFNDTELNAPTGLRVDLVAIILPDFDLAVNLTSNTPESGNRIPAQGGTYTCTVSKGGRPLFNSSGKEELDQNDEFENIAGKEITEKDELAILSNWNPLTDI